MLRDEPTSDWVLVPEEELEENLVGADDKDLILDFDLNDAPEEVPMDQLNWADIVHGLQNEIIALRNEHTHIGNDNDAHVHAQLLCMAAIFVKVGAACKH